MDEYVNIKNIIYQSLLENKSIGFAMGSLLSAYWLQDVIFPNSFSKFTANVPEFIKEVNIKKIGIVVMPFVIAEIFFFINNMIVSYKIPAIELAIVKKITNSVIESIKTTKQQINTNELMMNLKKVLETKMIYNLVISNIFPFILISIGFIYNFSKANTKLGLIALMVITIFIIITLYIQSKSINAACENEDAINEFYDNIQDIMINADTVITSNTKQKEIDNINENSKNVKMKYSKSEKKAAENTFILHILSMVIIVILDGIAIKLYMEKKIKIDILISICLISITFMKYYNSTMSKFRNSINYIGKYYEIEQYFKEFKISVAKEQILNISSGDISFSNVNLKYGDNVIFNNFNKKIKGGTKIGIVGNIGTGKSSLLKMLSGLIEYDGTIYIDNQNLKQINYDSIQNHIIYISQHPKMFNKTILYNLSYGTVYDEAYVNEFLKSINFYDFFQKFEGGLQNKVGKEGKNLSGGQKQIIAILRSLLQNKSIILLDEPTSSLDPNTKANVIKLLKNIKNKTLIIVTHDEMLYEVFDDMIRM
jgi:ABC-type multidrug transport system fused ATPase/permease subunit